MSFTSPFSNDTARPLPNHALQTPCQNLQPLRLVRLTVSRIVIVHVHEVKNVPSKSLTSWSHGAAMILVTTCGYQ